MDMQVDPERSSASSAFDDPEALDEPAALDELAALDEPAALAPTPLDDLRLEHMIRWHGTDETNLPPADTLKNLSRDTIAALHELRAARATIGELRAAMGRAFWATDFRTLHDILLRALGPPPNERSQ